MDLERSVIEVTASGLDDRGSIADTNIFLFAIFATSYIIIFHTLTPPNEKRK
jgi:hypothetical protein